MQCVSNLDVHGGDEHISIQLSSNIQSSNLLPNKESESGKGQTFPTSAARDRVGDHANMRRHCFLCL